MHRIIPSKTVHLSSQESVALYHNHGVASFHGENKVVIVLASADISKLESRLHHTTGSITVIRKDTRREGAVVGSDSHATIQFLAFLHQWNHCLDKVSTLLEIFFFCFVNPFVKVLGTIGKVPGVDTNFFYSFSDSNCDFWLEVHISTKWYIVPLFE